MVYAQKNVLLHLLILLAVPLCTLFYDTVYSQEDSVNSNTLKSIVNQSDFEASAGIKVGSSPSHIYGDFSKDAIYVANSDSGTVSVIDITTGNVLRTINVGGKPGYIYGYLESEVVYVANSGSIFDEFDGFVSAIDVRKYNVTNIPVGGSPEHIFGDQSTRDVIYTANYDTGNVTVIDENTYNVTQQIAVGGSPRYIYGDLPYSEVIYVATGGVSIINTSSFNVTNIGPLAWDVQRIYSDSSSDVVYVPTTLSLTRKDIASYAVLEEGIAEINKTGYNFTEYPLERPIGDMYLDSDNEVVYMTNPGYFTVSILESSSSTIWASPTIGHPQYIYSNPDSDYAGDDDLDAVYVADDKGFVTAIDKYTFDLTHIPVGENPRYIYGDPSRDVIYVANSGSNDVSVINSVTNEVMAGITFGVTAARTGNIICDGLDAPLNRPMYVVSGAKCIAEPNDGFEFSSWGEIKGNSTRTINATNPSASFWTVLSKSLGMGPDDPAATLNVNRFGNFTAYFRALPPPVPADYWVTLFSIIATALVGSLLIPAVIGWTKSKRQTSRLKSFHDQMVLAYEDKKLDENDIPQLNLLNKNISDSYAAGKINNEQYTNLKNEVSIAYEEIFKGRIDAQGKSSYGIINRMGDLKEIREDISDAYSKGKITKLHYDLLNEKISKMTLDKKE